MSVDSLNPVPPNELALGDCVQVLRRLPEGCVDFVLTDPPYLVNYQDRAGRSIAGDVRGDWLGPALAQVYRVMRPTPSVCRFTGGCGRMPSSTPGGVRAGGWLAT